MAERKYEEVMKINAQLERNNSDLNARVNLLQEELSLTGIRVKDSLRVRVNI